MNTADKTTLKSLITVPNPPGPSGVAALINARTPEQKAKLHQRLTDAIRNSAPPIGQYWKGQGGYYAGIIRDGDRQWHLILADTPSAEGKWGDQGVELAGEFSRRDGMYNTHLILASDSTNEIANQITELTAEGHVDCYWPSQCENNLFRINLPEHFSAEHCWSSTQYHANYAWYEDMEDGYHLGVKIQVLAAKAARRILIE